jgi:zinc transport system ATP-binding protein
MMGEGPLLRVEGLVAGHRTAPVIGPVTFTLSPGEVIGLWGANGVGKSTLLNAIAGTARQFAGAILRRPGLTLAYQEQRPARLPLMPMTGRDLLRAAGIFDTPPPARLRPWLGQRLDTLSGGEFQLLNVWATLGGGMDLVLLDEPTNNLDPGAESFLGEFLAAPRGGQAVLLVSHERDFLDAVCQRVLEVVAWKD